MFEQSSCLDWGCSGCSREIPRTRTWTIPQIYPNIALEDNFPDLNKAMIWVHRGLTIRHFGRYRKSWKIICSHMFADLVQAEFARTPRIYKIGAFLFSFSATNLSTTPLLMLWSPVLIVKSSIIMYNLVLLFFLVKTRCVFYAQ